MTNQIIINAKSLEIKEYKGQRVVTFKDVDSVHDRPEGTASRNFRTNRNYFVEGEDYFKITPDEFRRTIGDMDKRQQNDITLLTESGYFMLAKSLTDDLSWSVQRQLINGYFRVQQEVKQLSPIEMIAQIANNAVETEKRLKSIEAKQQAMEERTDKLLDVFSMPTNITWHEAITSQFKKICHNNSLNYQTTLSELYKQLESEVGCDLTSRQRNKRKRMKLAGCTHTRTIKETSKIMLIEDDDALRLAFENIFRQFQVRYLHEKES